MIKSFDSYPFVVDKHNNVWKYIETKDHFLKVTPWETDEDRRVNRFEIENLISHNKLVQMKNRAKVHEIINNKWKDFEFSWNYNGDTYVASPNSTYNDAMKAPEHSFTHTYKDQHGIKHSYDSKYRLGFYKGNLIWFNPYHYFPQVCIWNFEKIDKEPKGYNSWTKISHIRPIWSYHTTGYL